MQRKIKQATPLMDKRLAVVQAQVTKEADPQPRNPDPIRKDPTRLHLKNPVEITVVVLAAITTKRQASLESQWTSHIKAISCTAYCVTSNIHHTQNSAQRRETNKCKTPVMHKNASR